LRHALSVELGRKKCKIFRAGSPTFFSSLGKDAALLKTVEMNPGTSSSSTATGDKLVI